jgi:hypothetical protein
MPNPIKAVKALSRAVGGITGKGAKQVNPVYRNIGPSVKVVPSKTTPKTGLENRGQKVSRGDRAESAKEMLKVRKKQTPKSKFFEPDSFSKKTIKVNSNPNKTPAKGIRNPTKTLLDIEEYNDPWYDKYGYPPTEIIKIKSSIPKRGKQRGKQWLRLGK